MKTDKNAFQTGNMIGMYELSFSVKARATVLDLPIFFVLRFKSNTHKAPSQLWRFISSNLVVFLIKPIRVVVNCSIQNSKSSHFVRQTSRI